jgi:fumarylacetoacetase
MNDTHDPQLRSWVESANQPGTDFPIQNLPLGVFRRGTEPPRIGVAIGDCVLDLTGCADELPAAVRQACRASSLNALMALGNDAASALRRRVSELLREKPAADVRRHVLPQRDVEMLLPANIGDYTDFYASIHHATNVGKMFRPDQPLTPNYKFLPVAYHGRASSIVVSGTPIRRPCGQTKTDQAEQPEFGPTRALDYELEVGFFVGPGNPLGEPIPIAEAEQHVFGFCLLNDWSARDIQKWEYQPLGPFLGKNFATTISPWIVTLEALEPFRAPANARETLPYLNASHGGLDLTLEAWLGPVRLSRSNSRDLYWTVAQMVAHHTCNGCNLRPGDLLASGTVSGPTRESRGCLLELTAGGTEPLELRGGERRRFLEDGDEVILRGYCERTGFARIGFGECRGRILPAPA